MYGCIQRFCLVITRHQNWFCIHKWVLRRVGDYRMYMYAIIENSRNHQFQSFVSIKMIFLPRQRPSKPPVFLRGLHGVFSILGMFSYSYRCHSCVLTEWQLIIPSYLLLKYDQTNLLFLHFLAIFCEYIAGR